MRLKTALRRMELRAFIRRSMSASAAQLAKHARVKISTVYRDMQAIVAEKYSGIVSRPGHGYSVDNRDLFHDSKGHGL